ncbi:hypothetical protein C8R47DRAFT_658643 [Mycena vitilis]|nr:hypothetical protein C8R47DRAFT_658643 [Mycena vitilis]
MVKYSNFKTDEDRELIHFLADPTRVFQDPNSMKTYEGLGPGSEYAWSHGHKYDGWYRRALLLEDIDGHILREARRIAKRQKNDLTAVEKKPKISKERKSVGSKATKTEFDVEDDIARLAEETQFTVELVREVFRLTQSIVAAGRMLYKLNSARGVMADDEPEGKGESSSEEDELPIVVKKKAAPKPALKKSAAKRKRDEDESEEDDAPPVVKREKRAVEKKPAAPARKTPAKKPVSRAKAKTVKYVEADSDSDSEEEEEEAPRPAKRRRT